VTTPSELLSLLRVIEHALENLDPASMPIDEVIEMFFDLAVDRQVTRRGGGLGA
jgi:hypothetical protein